MSTSSPPGRDSRLLKEQSGLGLLDPLLRHCSYKCTLFLYSYLKRVAMICNLIMQ